LGLDAYPPAAALRAERVKSVSQQARAAACAFAFAKSSRSGNATG